MQPVKTLKNLLILLVAVSATASTALAHDMHMASSKEGFLGLKPEYLHVLLHPVLTVGLALAVVALAAGLVMGRKAVQVVALALALVLGCSATAWPVLGLGQNAYNRVRPQADEAGQQWMKEHMRRAETFVYIFYGTTLLAAAALISHRKFPRAVLPLTVATIVAGAASLGVGGWISKAGGQIRHPEFRGMSAPSTNAAPHEHRAAKQAHENVMTSRTSTQTQ